ncbi:4-hydroxy-tetrahydrodipicolinate reductase [Granulibacter bethesdensis]|uniref:4-hydroxy-tetrahydrodipicolinate reductase n=1 Tax=Granulibacter bethesdensis TaxID=364410 RepID=UPI0003F1DB95|nr:4-hydroxy-tetrahydrodipicolinate reductase [Granulibacter bethesdensis]AHJ69618.1 Dihydrodipicolinate reductase [Granulibacter bethesdensis]
MSTDRSIRIGIAGMAGRMGSLLVEESAAQGTVSGGTLRPGSNSPAPAGVHAFADISALAEASDAVIDFTSASTVQTHARALSKAGTAWILGTSGLSPADEKAVEEVAALVPVVYAPNFAPGVNLVLALAEKMAAALPGDRYDAEIVEMHHRRKIDSPSGTAIGLGRAVAAGRGVALEEVIESGRHGHVGPRQPGAIGFAALRGGQVVGEHTLLFAADDEHIALTHRAFDRRAFARGAVQAALWVQGKPPGLYSMMDVLGMR